MSSKKPLISAIVNTKNEAKYLGKCLRSIVDLADEIIVVDMHSTDNSQQVAKKFNARIFSYRPTPVVEHARNFALSKARGKWILLLDPDEYLNKTLKRELLKIAKRSDVDFVKIPRKNMVFGKWLRHTSMWPDYLIRFFKKNAVTWQREIHSQPQTSGNGLTLLDSEKIAIRHENYTSITDYLHRAIRYSNVQADELKKADYGLKISDLILRPTQEFNSRFFSAQGYKDGLHGLIFSLLQAFSVCLIYIRLWEKQGAKDKSLSKDSFVSASQESAFEYDYWFSRYFVNEYTRNIFKIILLKIRHWTIRLFKNL